MRAIQDERIDYDDFRLHAHWAAPTVNQGASRHEQFWDWVVRRQSNVEA